MAKCTADVYSVHVLAHTHCEQAASLGQQWPLDAGEQLLLNFPRRSLRLHRRVYNAAHRSAAGSDPGPGPGGATHWRALALGRRRAGELRLELALPLAASAGDARQHRAAATRGCKYQFSFYRRSVY